MESLIWITTIIMAGSVLAIVAWQILSIGKSAMEKGVSEDVHDLRKRVDALEAELDIRK